MVIIMLILIMMTKWRADQYKDRKLSIKFVFILAVLLHVYYSD